MALGTGGYHHIAQKRRERQQTVELTCKVFAPNEKSKSVNMKNKRQKKKQYFMKNLQNRWSCLRGRQRSRSGHPPLWARRVATDRKGQKEYKEKDKREMKIR